MGRNFYTGTEAELASGSTNVVAIVSPSPEDFGLTPSQIASYSSLAESFNAALSLSVTPSTRTPVRDRPEAESEATAQDGVGDAGEAHCRYADGERCELTSLHMNVHPTPTRRHVPAAAPVVRVISVVGRVVTLRVRDSASQMRGLPFGASGANLYSFVGNSPPEDPREYHFEKVTQLREDADHFSE